MKTKEKLKRPLNCIYFYLTEGCNLCCSHCYLNPKHEDKDHKYNYLDLDLFKDIIKQAKPLGLKSVKLTGGEPLMHPKIKEILEVVKQEDLRLVVETNGVLCTEEIAELISKCKNPFASVSLDGSDAETN
jgi:MoaA/NifB/PqqE/SkfB family radical SAM enzyme